jgi:NAD+ diphosphatase
MQPANFYSASGFDRIGHRRKDDTWLAEQMAAAATRFLPLWRAQHLIDDHPEGPRPILLDRAQLERVRGTQDRLALLGVEAGAAYFAIDLAHESPLDSLALPDGAQPRFQDLRAVGPLLARRDGALLAYAKGLLYWHRRHKFCGVCGTITKVVRGRPCPALHQRELQDRAFPAHRSGGDHAGDHHGDKCLLGRGKQFPRGMHSTLAGFVEPGESFEDAVAREVYEEVKVRVKNVIYRSSQPWPFPASVMIGFHATARTTQITVDHSELQDARWFHRDWLIEHRGGSDEFRLPRPDSIARRLIEEWLAEG